MSPFYPIVQRPVHHYNIGMIIDTHVHMYPDLNYGFQKLGIALDTHKLPFKKIKSIAAGPRQRWNMLMQDAASNMRKLPQKALPFVEKAHALSTLGNVALCCTKQDLLESMKINGIEKAVVIAHPPLIPNEFILNECNNEDSLLPVVNIPESVQNPKEILEEYVSEGAVALKIHAAADGRQVEDKHYRQLLEKANELKLPVIIHTGCIHIQPAYKDPDMGHAKHFVPWFESYPNVNFILAHMNYHSPESAIEYCEDYSNVYCDCSWQPAHIIEEALKRIPTKLMFGTDWPLIGSNQDTMVKRVSSINIESSTKELFYRETAIKIFKL